MFTNVENEKHVMATAILAWTSWLKNISNSIYSTWHYYDPNAAPLFASVSIQYNATCLQRPQPYWFERHSSKNYNIPYTVHGKSTIRIQLLYSHLYPFSTMRPVYNGQSIILQVRNRKSAISGEPNQKSNFYIVLYFEPQHLQISTFKIFQVYSWAVQYTPTKVKKQLKNEKFRLLNIVNNFDNQKIRFKRHIPIYKESASHVARILRIISIGRYCSLG